MSNITININLESFQNWVNIVITRMSHLTVIDALWLIVAVILPPIAVLLKVGFTVHFWINLVLTFLGFIPGQIHALWVVLFSGL